MLLATDTRGIWDGDARGLVERALFIVEPRYSAFDLTPLRLAGTKLAATVEDA